MPPSVSLLALRAFAHVGQHGSVKRAAAVQGVTPGAISQQVKLLEQRLGVKLLERRSREIRLTAEGLRLFEPLAKGFQQIEDAVGLFETRPQDRHILSVSTTASFAASWLVPRLGRFSDRHPGIHVRVDTTARLADLRNDDVDVALRHGRGDYPGLEAFKIIAPHLICVGSPELVANGPSIEGIEDCLRYPLLQDRNRSVWPAWFRAHGAMISDTQARRGPSFENDMLLIRAAIAGQGLALVRDVYATDELDAKRLFAAFAESAATPDSYEDVTFA
ncbi:LysR substrate-binding domain-containing protein [Bradyrhizobium sp. 31Argb]|uniref:LysR substrate-binding domain-containing protein n=1 Tax=Bradyrhizobium sp. 31Argb TaxID=3141247 RepID=UPI00374A7CF2